MRFALISKTNSLERDESCVASHSTSRSPRCSSPSGHQPSPNAGRGRGADGGGGAGLPLTPTKALKFTTDEGTWLSLDVSPDGRTVVFELLGDIYTIPIEGGKATRLTSGQPFDAQPHYSPDGKSIVVRQRPFAVGQPVDHECRRVESARIDSRKRSAIPIAGVHAGRQVRRRIEGQRRLHVLRRAARRPPGCASPATRPRRDAVAPHRAVDAEAPAPNVFLGPAPSKDGRYIYFAMRNSTNGGYNQTSLGWQIGVLDRETGRTFTKTNAVGSGMRPELSPDGNWLAYATRNNAETSLMLRDLANGR